MFTVYHLLPAGFTGPSGKPILSYVDVLSLLHIFFLALNHKAVQTSLITLLMNQCTYHTEGALFRRVSLRGMCQIFYFLEIGTEFYGFHMK